MTCLTDTKNLLGLKLETCKTLAGVATYNLDSAHKETD